MIYAAKILADGQLPLATAAIYTARADSFVTIIICVNNNAGSVVLNLYIKPKGSIPRKIVAKDSSVAGKAALRFDGPLTLQSGDEIQGDSTVADVDFIVLGGLIP